MLRELEGVASCTRSTPLRVNTASWTANSVSVPWNMRPPIELYSPSVFSRTTQKSMSPGLRLASGDRHALEQAHRAAGSRTASKPRRIGISRPHSETWSGTPGQPTAPRKMLSNAFELLHAVVRHHRAGLAQALARPVVIGELELEAEAARRRLPARARPPARSPCRCRRPE